MRVHRNHDHHGGWVVNIMGRDVYVMPARVTVVPMWGDGWVIWLGAWITWR